MLADVLMAAAQRACDVSVVLESEAESGGKVTFELAAALGSAVAAHAKIFPLTVRPSSGDALSTLTFVGLKSPRVW